MPGRCIAIPFGFVLAIALLSGCASQGGLDMEAVGDGFRTVGAKLESGVSRLRKGRSSKGGGGASSSASRNTASNTGNNTLSGSSSDTSSSTISDNGGETGSVSDSSSADDSDAPVAAAAAADTGNEQRQRIRAANRAAEIAAQFPSDQVPNTLMKKPVADGRLTSGFGYRLSPTGLRLPKKHKGVDYAAPTGTPVYAAGDGVIIKRYISKTYGNYIRIRHENGFETGYAHMVAFADGLDEGSTVSRGQQIGAVGTTGRSTAAHLHFELLYNGDFIDPLLGGPDNAVALAD